MIDMVDCEFSVIKYVPDIARFEPVNIGISLLDKQNKNMHNKYITNFNAFFKRLGVENIHGLERSFENYKPLLTVDSTDYLWKLHDSFHGSVFYSEPIKINAKEIEITLQQVFNKMISIPEKKQEVKESITIPFIRTKIRQYIEKLEFPEKTYQEKYEIQAFSGIPQIRDFAFIKDGELINTIDVVNFAEGSVFDTLKLFLHEIKDLTLSEKYPKNRSLIFGTMPIDQQKASPITKQSIEYMNMSRIPIINPNEQEEIIQEIRSIID
jgi:hypothetical protein